MFDAWQPLSDTRILLYMNNTHVYLRNIWIGTIFNPIVYFISSSSIIIAINTKSHFEWAVFFLDPLKRICNKHLKRHFIQPNFKSIKLHLSVNHLDGSEVVRTHYDTYIHYISLLSAIISDERFTAPVLHSTFTHMNTIDSAWRTRIFHICFFLL